MSGKPWWRPYAILTIVLVDLALMGAILWIFGCLTFGVWG